MVRMSVPRWSQHALVEENERVHGLVLGGCGHVALRGQMGQEGLENYVSNRDQRLLSH